MKPGPAYIAPTSGFFFGQAGQSASLIDFLPSRLAADRLIKQFFIAVHPITQILHRPSFEKEYDTFWDEVSLGIEPPNSVQSMVFAVMFAGLVSMDPPDVIRDFGVSKDGLIDNFRLGTETALSRANFLRTTKIETLQAFVLYLVCLLTLYLRDLIDLTNLQRSPFVEQRSLEPTPYLLERQFVWLNAWDSIVMERIMASHH